jgi:hypothetical protein
MNDLGVVDFAGRGIWLSVHVSIIHHRVHRPWFGPGIHPIATHTHSSICHFLKKILTIKHASNHCRRRLTEKMRSTWIVPHIMEIISKKRFIDWHCLFVCFSLKKEVIVIITRHRGFSLGLGRKGGHAGGHLLCCQMRMPSIIRFLYRAKHCLTLF